MIPTPAVVRVGVEGRVVECEDALVDAELCGDVRLSATAHAPELPTQDRVPRVTALAQSGT